MSGMGKKGDYVAYSEIYWETVKSTGLRHNLPSGRYCSAYHSHYMNIFLYTYVGYENAERYLRDSGITLRSLEE